MKTILTLTELIENGVDVPDYAKSMMDEAVKFAEEISEFYPATPIFQCFKEKDVKSGSDSDDLVLDRAYVRLDHPTIDIRINYNAYRKKYYISEWTTECMKNITRYDVSDYRSQNGEPNKIGVLTTSKIQAWVTFYENLLSALIIKNGSRKNKVDEFLAEIEGLPVKWFNENKQGEIVMNGIKFSFTIHETGVSKKIEIYDVENTIDNFTKLAHNQYKQLVNS